MASNFMRKPGLQTSPLQDLAAYFQKVRTQEGIVSYAPLWLHTSTTDEITVSLPNPILNTIKQSRDHGSEHSEREVDAVVGALESSTPQLCMRLDTRGLLVLCSVLVHAQACLAQHRGLYLLKEALLASPDDGVQKAAVGSEALLPLIKGFLKSDNTDETRRWMGVVALELLSFCPANIAILRKDYRKMRSLGVVLKEEQTHMLQLLAGLMINVMSNGGVIPTVVWMSTIEQILSPRFPTPQRENSWICELDGLAMDLDTDDIPAQRRCDAFFACAVSIGSTRYSINEESAILVTVPNDINIIMPDTSTTPAMYVDISVDNIRSLTVESEANSQSQSSFYVLTIRLYSDTGCTCYFNATAKTDRSIALAFASESHAKTLYELLHCLGNWREASPEEIVLGEDEDMEDKATTNEDTPDEDEDMEGTTIPKDASAARMSISQGIPVSQPSSTDRAVSQSAQGDQVLAQSTASFKGQGQATYQPRLWEPTTSNQLLVPAATQLPEAPMHAQNLSHHMSIAFGINVTQPNRDDMQIDTRNDIQPSDITARHCSDQPLSKAAENHQQHHVSITDGSLSQSSSMSVQGLNNLPENNMVVDASNNANPSELLVADLQEPSQSMQVTDAKHSVEVQEPRSDGPTTTKLSRSMRTKNGNVGNSSAETDRTLSADAGTKLKAKRQKINKGRVLPYPEVKADGNRRDEYEIQASPEDTSDARSLRPSTRRARVMERNMKDIESETDVKSQRGLRPLPKIKVTKAKRAVPTDSEAEVMQTATSTDEQSTKDKRTGQVESEGEPELKTSRPNENPAQDFKSDVKGSLPKRNESVVCGQPSKALKGGSMGMVRDRIGRFTKAKKTPETLQQRMPATKVTKTSKTLQQRKPRAKAKEDLETSGARQPTDELTSEVSDRGRPKRDAAERAKALVNGLIRKGKTSDVTKQVKDASTATALEKLIKADDTTDSSTSSDNQKAKAANAKNRKRAPVAHPRSQKPLTETSPKENAKTDASRNALESSGENTSEPDLHKGTSNEVAPTLNPQEKGAEQASVSDGAPQIHNAVQITNENITANPATTESHGPLQPGMVGNDDDIHFQAAMQTSEEEPTVPEFARAPEIVNPARDKYWKLAVKKVVGKESTEDILGSTLASMGTKMELATNNLQLPKSQNKGRARRVTQDQTVANPTAATIQQAEAEAEVEPATGEKRKGDSQPMMQSKKAKMAHLATPNVKTTANGTDEGADRTTALPAASKKPALIGWGTSGPKNQGMVSARKVQRHHIETTAPGQENRQRTTGDEVTTPLGNSVSLKLSDVTTPPQNHMHEPSMITEPASFAKEEKAQRVSSQSTKVNRNGSPLPQVQTTVNDEALEEPRKEVQSGITRAQKASDGEKDGKENGFHNDFVINATGDKDGVGDTFFVNGKKYVIFDALDSDENGQPLEKVGNGKQVPNPPKAPSSVELSPRHEVLDNGEIVNSKTSDRVTPIEPLQNPFISEEQMAPSSFVTALRQDAHSAAQRNDGEATKEKPSGGLKRKSISDNDEDPSETLVELKPKQKRQKGNHNLIAESSLTSSSSSQDVAAPGEESGDSSDELSHDEDEIPYEISRWIKTMDRKKGTILDILCVIIHRLVRHLSDKELSSIDVLREYEQNGGNLLARYAQERSEIAKTDKKLLDRIKATLSIVYLDAIKEKSQKQPVREMDRPSEARTALEARWDAQAARRTTAIVEAAKACFE